MTLPILSAILGIIAFLPANFWFFGFIFLAPLFIFFIKENGFWRLVLGVFIFRLIFGLGTAYFTLEPIMWGSSILIFLGLAVSIFLIKEIYKYLLPATATFYSLLFSLPFLWTFFDHLEARYSLLPTYIITAGNIFGSSPFLGLATIGGLTFLTFFAALINVLVAACVLKIKTSNPKPLALSLATIFFLILGAWQISDYQIKKNSVYYSNLKNSFRVAVVSANEKFDFSQFDQLENELANKQIDFIVFPEDILNEPVGLYPFHSELASSGGNYSVFLMPNLAKELNANLIAVFDTLQNQNRYNSAVLFDKKGEIVNIYNKSRLTFVGEYWPFGNWRPPFSDWVKRTNPEFGIYAMFDPSNAYSRGSRKVVSVNLQKNAVLFASPICLEVHYPTDLKEYVKNGARFIVNPTSNRWLNIGLNHFLYLANNLKKIEAVWLKMPIISSGVKDFAGIILPDSQARLINYQAGDKNYSVFIGEIKY